jgi:RNA polymerase sigma-70 factor (ECF subfamily)
MSAAAKIEPQLQAHTAGMVATWRDAALAAVAGCAKVTSAQVLAHVEAAIAAGAAPAHAGDLALACAVAAGDPEAARRFDALCGPELVAAARGVDGDRAFVDEIAQQARVRLVVGDGGPPRIATYRGAGPLRAWVAIATQRLALNAKRAARGAAIASDDVLADVVDREPDPELRHLKEVYRAEFREALSRALEALADRARAVLRLRFVDGLELAQIGRLYAVHESTASRWVAGALAEVADAARADLVARLSITDGTADSVARMVRSQLDLSIARLLG